MRTNLLILVLAMLFPTVESFAETGFSRSASDNTTGVVLTYEERSCWEGAFYTAVPGIVFHGAGCFYAQSPKTAYVLLATEAAGVVLIMAGMAASTTHDLTFRGAGDDSEGGALVATGALLFGGSWIADIIATQVLIRRHNEEARRVSDNLSLLVGTSTRNKKTITIGFAYSF